MMTKEQEEQAVRVLQGLDISDVMRVYLRCGGKYNKRTLKFFRWFCKYAPIAIMCFHAFGVWEFAQHPREMFVMLDENIMCYYYIYFMLYVFPMVIIFASRFFWLCWKYRVPFFYFFGVNAIHIVYGELFTTNAMVMAHYSLDIFIVTFYLYGLADFVLSKTKCGKRVFS